MGIATNFIRIVLTWAFDVVWIINNKYQYISVISEWVYMILADVSKNVGYTSRNNITDIPDR